ncbi:MAG TPA: FtsW/RodA/SpoVE family cell cycle protein [Anaerolineales bacterium]|nr:FtsW/RodA/SpoVE family cell cycle protein [Anaerolineales bacterium]
MNKLFRERMRGADLGFDHIMLLLVLALIILGLMTVASSSWGASYSLSPTHSVWYLFSRQLVWGLIGLVMMAITFRIDYHRWQRWALPVGMLTVVMLIAVVVVNWDSPVRRGLFNDSVQASEVAKFATVIYLGVWLVSKSQVLDNLSLGIVPYAVLIGAFAGLILMEPDISAAATVVILGMAMFFLGGGGYRNVALATVVMAAGGLVLALVIRPARIEEYLAGWRDIRESNLHIFEALSAISSGGLIGVGAGASRFKYFSLPAAHTDSVFAVVAEELGFVGALVVLVLFALLIWRGYRIAVKAPDSLGLMFAAGMTTWIAVEALVNIMTILALLPFAGNALPFFSYGGSNLVMTMAAMGLVLNVSRADHHRPQPEKVNASTDQRWGDGRGHLPRSGRRPGRAS